MKLFNFGKKKKKMPEYTPEEMKELVDGIEATEAPGHGDWRDAQMAAGGYRKSCTEKLREIGEPAIPYLFDRVNRKKAASLLAEMNALDLETILSHYTESTRYGIMRYLQMEGKDMENKEKIISLYRQSLSEEEHMLYREEAVMGLIAYGEPNMEGELLKLLEDTVSEGIDEDGVLKFGFGEEQRIGKIASKLKEMKAKEALKPLKALAEKVEPKIQKRIEATIEAIEEKA